MICKRKKEKLQSLIRQEVTLTSRGNDSGRQAEIEIRRDRQAHMNSRCALKTFSNSDSKYFKVTRGQSWLHTCCFVHLY